MTSDTTGQAVNAPPSSSQPHPQLISAPSELEVVVTTTSQPNTNADSATQTPRTGTQSKWPPDESGEVADESDTEFGYATVRETDPVLTLDYVDPAKATQPLPDLPISPPPLNMTGQKAGGRSTPQMGGHDSDIDSPALLPNAYGTPASRRDHSRDTSATPEGAGSDHSVGHREPIPTTADPETLYAKVHKPPQSHQQSSKRHSLSSADITPNPNSPRLDTGPSKEQVRHVESQHMEHQSRQRHSPMTTLHTGIVEPGHGSGQKHSPMTTHVNKKESGQPYYSKLRQEKVNVPSQRGGPEVIVSQGRPDGRGTGFEVAEYTDEDYMPSGDDSFTITETSFSDDQLLLQQLSTTVSPRSSKQAKVKSQRPASSAAVAHRPPVVSPPLPPRPSTSTPLPGQPEANIPFIHPSFIQQVSSVRPQSQPVPFMDTGQGEVYIFSEKQPDGSEQFYAASPVQSLSKAEQISFQSPSTPPLVHRQTSPNLLAPRHLPESHYYSQPSGDFISPSTKHVVLPTPTPPTSVLTQQSHDSAQGQTRNVTIKGTRITKLGNVIGGGHSSTIPQSTPNINLALSPRDSGLDELDAGLPSRSPAEAGAQDDSEYLKLREKIRSLTAEKATLSKQLANERKQLKMKEVYTYPIYYTHSLHGQGASQVIGV